jgi:hypothetical protein
VSEVIYNNISGTLGGSGLAGNSSASVITFSSAPAFPTLAASVYAKLEIDPGVGGPYEIGYLSSFTSGGITGTLLRGQEGTSAQGHVAGATWIHGATAADYQSYTPLSLPWLVVSGQHVYEGASGPRYRPTGYNCYTWAQTYDSGNPNAYTVSAASQDKFLSQCRPNSLFRVWGIAPQTGYTWAQALGFMDSVVNLMTRYGHRVLFMLTNYNGTANDLYYGPAGVGQAKTQAWFDGSGAYSPHGPQYVAANYDAYTSTTGFSFEDWARTVATRYASNPTVAGYDLMNEIQDYGGAYTAAIVSFASYMSNVIKTANPNALVYMGTQYPAAVGGNTQFESINSVLDFCSCHDYTTVGFPEKAIGSAICAQAINEPLLIDETGVWAKGQYGLPGATDLDPNGLPAVPWDVQAEMAGDYLNGSYAIDCVCGVLTWAAIDTDEGTEYTVASVTLNGTTAATASSFPNITRHMVVKGDYITPGTSVSSVSGGTVTLSAAATGSGTVTLTFSGFYNGLGNFYPLNQSITRYTIRDQDTNGVDFNYATIDNMNGWLDLNQSVKFAPGTQIGGPNSGTTTQNVLYDRWVGSGLVSYRQSTASVAPTAEQGQVPGGFPSLGFSGTEWFSTAGAWLMGGAGGVNQQHSFYAIICPTAFPTLGVEWLISSHGGSGPSIYIDSSGYVSLVVSGYVKTLVIATSSVPLSLNTLHLVEVQWDATATGTTGSSESYAIYIDGVQVATGSATHTLPGTGVTAYIGGMSRVATTGGTSGSPTITDLAIATTDIGEGFGGVGVPPNSYVGTVSSGSSFLLSSSPTSQVSVNFTGTTGTFTGTYTGQGYVGHVAGEPMHFVSYLSPAERSRLYAYLGWRYGSFPNTSPGNFAAPNAATGTAVLVTGTIAVANTFITAASIIKVFVQTPGGTVGAPFVSAITPTTGFTISSTSALDTSTITYEIESY